MNLCGIPNRGTDLSVKGQNAPFSVVEDMFPPEKILREGAGSRAAGGNQGKRKEEQKGKDEINGMINYFNNYFILLYELRTFWKQI